MMAPGDLVMVRLTGTIIEGHFGTITEIKPRQVRWPILYVISLDMDEPDPERVDIVWLKAEEFALLG